jgi:hypothetical protein
MGALADSLLIVEVDQAFDIKPCLDLRNPFPLLQALHSTSVCACLTLITTVPQAIPSSLIFFASPNSFFKLEILLVTIPFQTC